MSEIRSADGRRGSRSHPPHPPAPVPATRGIPTPARGYHVPQFDPFVGSLPVQDSLFASNSPAEFLFYPDSSRPTSGVPSPSPLSSRQSLSSFAGPSSSSRQSNELLAPLLEHPPLLEHADQALQQQKQLHAPDLQPSFKTLQSSLLSAALSVAAQPPGYRENEQRPFTIDEHEGGEEEREGGEWVPHPAAGEKEGAGEGAEEVRALEHYGTTSLGGSIFNLSNTMIGAGMMALPAAMKVLGIITGSLALLFVALLTYASVMAMLRCALHEAENCDPPASFQEAAPSGEGGDDSTQSDTNGVVGATYGGTGTGRGVSQDVEDGGMIKAATIVAHSRGTVRSGSDGERASYNRVVEATLGDWGRLVLQLSILLNNLGLLMVFLDIIGDVLVGSSDGSIHGLIPLSPLNLTPHAARAVLLAVVVILAFPLTMKEKLGSMKLSSQISVALAFIFVGVVVLLTGTKIAAGRASMPPLFTRTHHYLTIFSVVNVITNAFICHFNVTPIYRELKDHSIGRFRVVVVSSITLSTLVYLAVGIFGLVLFGHHVHNDILYDFDDPKHVVVPGGFLSHHAVILCKLVKLGYAVSRFLSIPLALFQLRVVVVSLYTAFKRRSIHGVGAMSSASSRKGPKGRGRRRFITVTVSLLLLAYVGSVFVPDIWVLFQFMGCTAAVIIGFILPGLVALLAKGGCETVIDYIMAVALVVVGIVVGVLGIVINSMM